MTTQEISREEGSSKVLANAPAQPSSNVPYDPRAVANLILEEGERTRSSVTNLAMQKLLYFAHGFFLIEHKRPLVSGYFEAWQLGPVHPVAYQAFKAAGDRPINFRATGQDVLTGAPKELPPLADPTIRRHIERIMASYGALTAGRLVDISHAKGGPWDFVVNKGRTGVAIGLRISDDVIADRFKYHKVSVGDSPKIGEPGEDSPFT
ncbi:type VI toxin-antitoxin system SocA family antitoxin [Rhodoplanes sp. SY1]|uniref:type VI toxin-antitoxin system SocA family antitoxin n=1 Tax=Rhodoplanes sp. SY1 TaxID=3166646 RepID=UPI0038B6224D